MDVNGKQQDMMSPKGVQLISYENSHTSDKSAIEQNLVSGENRIDRATKPGMVHIVCKFFPCFSNKKSSQILQENSDERKKLDATGDFKQSSEPFTG